VGTPFRPIGPGSAKPGFTLIELMIVVSIIGILAAVAIPKFADLLRKSKEGALRGTLGSVRSALSIYYADNEGRFPSGPTGFNTTYLQDSMTDGGKYMSKWPTIEVTPYHAAINTVDSIPTDDPYATDSTGEGEWVYVSNQTDGNWGTILIECYHTDTKGTLWTTY